VYIIALLTREVTWIGYRNSSSTMHVPRLERLVIVDMEIGLHVSVISAPKLDAIGFLSDGRHLDHLYRLVFGATVIKVNHWSLVLS
jgi:hypothetical protein